MGKRRNPFIRPTTGAHIQSTKGLLYWMFEREIIRISKEAGKPRELWTEDPILKTYRFCNVRRQDDLVSRWLIEAIYKNEQFEDATDRWLLAAICRFVNWPPTLQYMLDEGVVFGNAEDFDRDRFAAVLRKFKEDKPPKVFTGAYMVLPAERLKPKEEGIATSLQYLVDMKREIRTAVELQLLSSVAETMVAADGVGSFMAGQFVADLTYEPNDMVNAKDKFEWAPIGPGSSRGMNYLMGHKPNKAWDSEQFCINLGELRDLALEKGLFPHDKTSTFSLHDMQNCMCEYAKYARTVLGEGKPRSKYTTNEGMFQCI